MTRYAENTSVSIDRSKAEIEKILGRYGAAGFGYMVGRDKAAVMFLAHGGVWFLLPLPDPKNEEFRKTATGRQRKNTTANEVYQQEIRRRWRALSLAIKAELEAVTTGITAFEQEFLAHIVLPNGQTVAEAVLPGVEEAYRTGKVQVLLPGW